MRRPRVACPPRTKIIALLFPQKNIPAVVWKQQNKVCVCSVVWKQQNNS